MKKILCTLLALLLIIGMAIPAYAVTPSFKIPDMPEIPDISDNIRFELPAGFWTRWFDEHPLPTFNLPSDWLLDRLGPVFGD